MTIQQVDLVARYQHLRQATRPITNQLIGTLSKKAMQEAGEKLGILRDGVLVFGSEDETAVLMDYCLFDFREQGMNAIERRLVQDPPPADSEELLILQGLRNARYSLFIVEAIQPGVGLHLRDLLTDVTIFIVDINFSNSAQEGLVLAARIVTIDGINMTTGASLPVAVIPASEMKEFVHRYLPQIRALAGQKESPEQASELAATIIQACLRDGASSRVRYAEPGEKVEREPLTTRHSAWESAAGARPRVGRNDPCPCGSGKKFKHCCGGRK